MPIVECKICHKGFYAKPRHIKLGWGKYCSVKCRSAAQFNGRNLRCEYCSKDIYRTPADIRKSVSGKFFCSRSCHCAWENKHSRSEDHSPNWTGGQNVYRLIIKRSDKEACCQKCGLKDERVLEVHHKDGNRRNNKLSNLIWLCRNCHCLSHIENKEAMVAMV
jgi:hypothetical protein